MKRIITILLAVFSFGTFAQDDAYENLLILKADKNWKKLIKSSESYTLKDKTKNDPVPYYYLAVGLYNISFDADRDATYKNAFKDALSTVGKFKRKDKDGAVFEEYREFFSDVKKTLVEVIQNDVEAGDYKKAFSWVMKVYKFDRKEIGAKFLEGACKYNSGDKSTARTRWKEAKLLVENTASIDSWMEEDKELLKMGVMESAKCLVKSRQVEKAKALLDSVAPWFEDDADFSEQYDDVVN